LLRKGGATERQGDEERKKIGVSVHDLERPPIAASKRAPGSI
jgi:hypothetical protein